MGRSPRTGDYDFVFDTPAGTPPGKFTFRVWMNDVDASDRPAASRARCAAGSPIRVAITDAGSGVDPHSIALRVGESHAHASSSSRAS